MRCERAKIRLNQFLILSLVLLEEVAQSAGSLHKSPEALLLASCWGRDNDGH